VSYNIAKKKTEIAEENKIAKDNGNSFPVRV